jgi:hypothetical protein
MSLNRAALLAEVLTNLPDNIVGEITPALVRATLNDILNNIWTLQDAQTAAALATLSTPPVLTGLTGVLYGNGSSPVTVATQAQVAGLIGAGSYVIAATGINFNLTGDTTFPVALPAGFTRYLVREVRISNASISLTTAQFGVYTGTLQGGVNIVAQTLTGITNNTAGTNLNAFSATVIDTGTRFYTSPTLYLNIGVAQGATATADASILITPLP